MDEICSKPKPPQDAQKEVKEIGFEKQFSVPVNGIPTEIVYHRFGRKRLLVITQLGKIAGIYNVSFDISNNPAMLKPVKNPDFHISVPITIQSCLGVDTVDTDCAIQFLVNNTKLWESPMDFVICLGLKVIDTPLLHALAKVLDEVVL
ncbi:GL19263 [Drosophila persimilis]|uniref:Uncharacterized protein n=2 Tax=pseudoobscura subgroup TaxID=32358 RepID=Q29N42_DROPS|nr:uncharacterized protein LOC4816913 [Drosophila pseudoobscura]XP_002014585.1 uncharacterized protein LOC6589872 [Drosophila persimilis]EDW28581.1 GL19263 [Drosophila persimilis]